MFYYFFDYTKWYQWYYNTPTEEIKLEEEPQKLFKEVETDMEQNKVEITAVEIPDVNIANLETKQENPIPKKSRRR